MLFPIFLKNTRSTIVIDQVEEVDVVNFREVIEGMIQKYKVILEMNTIFFYFTFAFIAILFFAMKCNQKVEAQSSHDNELLYEVLGILEPIVAYGYCWNVQENWLLDLVNILEDKNKSKYWFLVF